MVNEIATLIAEVLNDLVIGFSRSVEERSLLKCIFSAGVHSQLDQHCDHLEGNLGVWNDASRENRWLTEIFGLILDASHVDIWLTDHSDDFLDISSFDKVK